MTKLRKRRKRLKRKPKRLILKPLKNQKKKLRMKQKRKMLKPRKTLPKNPPAPKTPSKKVNLIITSTNANLKTILLIN